MCTASTVPSEHRPRRGAAVDLLCVRLYRESYRVSHRLDNRFGRS
jgi:hypothetical protein